MAMDNNLSGVTLKIQKAKKSINMFEELIKSSNWFTVAFYL